MKQLFNPVAIATKIAAVKNLQAPKVLAQLNQCPRLFEIPWFLNAQSRAPGGIEKFISGFLDHHAEQIGVPAMLPVPKNGAAYSPVRANEIALQIPEKTWEHFALQNGAPYPIANLFRPFEDENSAEARRHSAEVGLFGRNENECLSIAEPLRDPREESCRKRFLSLLTYDAIFKLCRQAAQDDLADHLDKFVDWPDLPLSDRWYFHGLVNALIQAMDAHAERESASIAQTEISKRIFEAMNLAWEEKALINIFANARLGKTTSARAGCRMFPGRHRYLVAPPSASESDLVNAFADVLGLDHNLSTSRRQIKARVEYVIKNCGLVFVVDESHFIWPVKFTSATAPMRLNWLRTQVIDASVGCVLVSTYQDFLRAETSFIKATKYNLEQFFGRRLLAVSLPNEIPPQDLLAVAQNQFPELDNASLKIIAGRAHKSQSPMPTIIALAKVARYIMRRSGRSEITRDDLESAIAQVIPGPAALKAPAPESAPPQPPQPLAERRKIQRGTRPATTEPVSRLSLMSQSTEKELL